MGIRSRVTNCKFKKVPVGMTVVYFNYLLRFQAQVAKPATGLCWGLSVTGNCVHHQVYCWTIHTFPIIYRTLVLVYAYRYCLELVFGHHVRPSSLILDICSLGNLWFFLGSLCHSLRTLIKTDILGTLDKWDNGTQDRSFGHPSTTSWINSLGPMRSTCK